MEGPFEFGTDNVETKAKHDSIFVAGVIPVTSATDADCGPRGGSFLSWFDLCLLRLLLIIDRQVTPGDERVDLALSPQSPTRADLAALRENAVSAPFVDRGTSYWHAAQDGR
jgi:hypothetical protein